MDIYITTQPVFDANIRVYAYEILHQSNSDVLDKDVSKSLINSFSTIGLNILTSQKPAFIQFTKNLIDQEIATLFPPDKLGIEIDESVLQDETLISKIIKLKEMNYVVSFGDFIYESQYEDLIDLADIIKVDFLNKSLLDKIAYAEKIKNKKITLYAKNIQSYEDYDYARKIGYSLFQGYFFSRPVVTLAKDTSPLKINYLHLIQKMNSEMSDYREIAEIISRDVSLSYKLLKLVNSALFGFRDEIKSINQALVILGERELKKWISLIALRDIALDKPDEIIRVILIRAKFMELIAGMTGLKNRASDMFLTGLFSMLDVCMGRPLEELLEDLPISADIKGALINKEGIFSNHYSAILTYEKGQWDDLSFYINKLNISKKQIINIYFDALDWYETVINQKID